MFEFAYILFHNYFVGARLAKYADVTKLELSLVHLMGPTETMLPDPLIGEWGERGDISSPDGEIIMKTYGLSALGASGLYHVNVRLLDMFVRQISTVTGALVLIEVSGGESLIDIMVSLVAAPHSSRRRPPAKIAEAPRYENSEKQIKWHFSV